MRYAFCVLNRVRYLPITARAFKNHERQLLEITSENAILSCVTFPGHVAKYTTILGVFWQSVL